MQGCAQAAQHFRERYNIYSPSGHSTTAADEAPRISTRSGTQNRATLAPGPAVEVAAPGPAVEVAGTESLACSAVFVSIVRPLSLFRVETGAASGIYNFAPGH